MAAQINRRGGCRSGPVLRRPHRGRPEPRVRGRGYDAVGRFGGEEFIALLDGVAPETAVNIAVRITQVIRALTPITADHGCARPLTASIGVASYPGDGTSIDELTAAADTAMYTAKTAGRDCVRHAETSINPTR